MKCERKLRSIQCKLRNSYIKGRGKGEGGGGGNYILLCSQYISLKTRGADWRFFFHARKDLPHPNVVKDQQLTMTLKKEKIGNLYYLRMRGSVGPVSRIDSHTDKYNIKILPKYHSYST